MAKDKIYIVHELCINNYETRWQDYHAYTNEANAKAKLRDIKEQDMMPIVEDENYEIHRDDPTHFEAVCKGEYSRGCVCVKIVTTPLLDGNLKHYEEEAKELAIEKHMEASLNEMQTECPEAEITNN